MQKNIKYENEILKSFTNLGFKPRDTQIECINQILLEFIDNKKENIILSAPTGSGKSIIGIIVTEVLSVLNNDTNLLKSTIGMHQNVLAEQYANTFKNNKNIIQIKGAKNYDCSIMDDTAEHCIFSQLDNMENGEELKMSHCYSCKFNKLKQQRNSVNHLITNYSFIFVDRMVTHQLNPRLCYIWDEAHLLNDVFTEHNAIFVSQKRLKDFIKDISNYPISIKTTPDIKKLLSALEKNSVNEKNYLKYIKQLNDLYISTTAYFDKEMVNSFRRRELTKIKILGNLSKKYYNFSCKISDLFSHMYPHVFDENTELKEFSIKAIFMGDMFDVLKNSKYNLFMSATLSEDFIKQTMHLDAGKTSYIKLESTFPKENKNIIFVKPLLNLNYQSMQKKETTTALKEAICKIAKFHDGLGESGIVLTPSFAVTELAAEALRKSNLKMTIFEHVRGEQGADILTQFKNFTGQGILISPSIFEGVDLPGDLSRFQILVKVPWPNLGDRRISLISKEYPKVYKAIALHKLIQGLGRSIRNNTDYATSYILDQHGLNLLMSPENVWASEFSADFVELKSLQAI